MGCESGLKVDLVMGKKGKRLQSAYGIKNISFISTFILGTRDFVIGK